jgi:hypothetical protein
MNVEGEAQVKAASGEDVMRPAAPTVEILCLFSWTATTCAG